MHKKKGDTLIEVALAIGIFSMVAIVVVSVISASTTAAQSSLEVTLAREELDAQAEALRFIHDSYVSGIQSADTSKNAYAAVWNKIIEGAVEETATNFSYNPTTCAQLYAGNGRFNENESGRRPFIINTRQLGNPSDVNNIVIYNTTTSGNGVFYEPSTYPRVVYGNRYTGATELEKDENLYYQTTNASAKLQRAEGIFIVAAYGNSQIVNGSSVAPQKAYYDFYIRSCWMPPSADRASTISTVVRLYDPTAITY